MAVEHLTAIVGARISEFKRRMAEVNAIARNAAREIRVQVDANTQPFQRAMARVRAQIAMINGRTIWLNLRARTDRFQNEMDELANVIRTFSTVGQNLLGGALMSLFPMIVPIIAATTATVATLGIAIGVLAGSTVALASSLSLALLGFVGLGVALIPTINNIKSARTEIAEGRRTLESYSKPMQRTITGLDKMKEKWLYLNESIEPDVLNAFGAGMESATILMDKLWPGINSVAEAFSGLMEKMKKAISSSSDMQKNFAWFNDRAAQAVNSWGEIIGYAFRGFLNLMRAFDPLARDTEAGLLRMTKRFSEWADGLSKSDKFKKFMDYVKENTPKVNAIIGNLIKGTINMFAAFGPLASDMLTSFKDMTARFVEWSAALGENQQFQAFIDYIRTNGPGVVDLIGNLTNFLIELGKGMAPLGAFLLKVTNGFLSWSVEMMRAHPWIGKFIAGFITFIGTMRMIIPVFIFFQTMFAGLATAIGRGIVIILSYLPLLGSWFNSLFVLIGRFALQVASWVPYVVSLFGRLVMGIGRWFMMLGTVIWEALATLGTVFGQIFMRIATVVGTFFTNIFMVVGRAVAIVASYVPLIVGIIGKIVGGVAGFFGRIAYMLGEFVVILGQVLIKGLIWAARMAAMWIIAAGPIAWVIAAVIALAALIIWKWAEIKAWSISTWNAIWPIIQAVWAKIVTATSMALSLVVEYVKSKFSQAKETVISIWNQILSGLTNILSNIKTAVSNGIKNVVERVRSGFSNIVSNSISLWNNVVSAIKSAWSNIKSNVSSAVSAVISKVKTGFQNMLSNIKSVYSNIKSAISSAWDSIKSAISSKLSSILSAVRSKFQELVSAVREKMNNVLSTIKSIWGNIRSFLSGINLASIGRNIIQGLINGVKSMASSLVSSVKGVVGGAIQGAKNLLNINSPSRVFMEFGQFTGEGFAIGMKDTMRTVARASSAMVGASMPSLSPLEVATPASNAVYTPKVNVPEIDAGDSKESDKKQAMYVNLSLGRGDYKGFVSEISETQREMDIRLKREAGN